VGFGLGYLLDHYHWGIWPYALLPFSLIGALLMLLLWNAKPAAHGAAH
jgi:OPA family glycerol-3-phosphate transporter-like MFS transporter